MEKGLETRQIYPVNDVTTRNKSTLRCSPFCTASIEVLRTCEAMYQANNAPILVMEFKFKDAEAALTRVGLVLHVTIA